MNTAKKVLITTAAILFCCNLFAQSITQPDLNKSLIPPSPEAASLGRYGIMPVTLYEGMPNVSIPVYEIKSSKLSLPISLSYNYNGYIPGSEASWIGMGWSLQAPGTITRVVHGLVDGVTPNVTHEWQDYANVTDPMQDQTFLHQVCDLRQIDPEPDVYIFNFNGHSGKFIVAGDKNPSHPNQQYIFTFPHQDLKISRIGNGFKIVTEDGTIYNFTTYETTTPFSSLNPGTYVPTYISSWNLTSIISSDNSDEIDFQYTPWNYRQYNNNYSETYTQQVGGTLGTAPNGPPCQGISCGCDTWDATAYPGALIEAQRLTRITSKHSVIKFIPESTLRMDLSGSTNAYALKEIGVYSLPDTIPVRKMELIHDYFGVNSQLKLSSVNLTGYYGGNTAASPNINWPGYYKFEYANEFSGSFPKITRGVDRWGFYNGKDNNQSLFEDGFLGYNPIRPTGDRNVDTSNAINGTLTKITYPTGGYTNFSYEGNKLRVPGTGDSYQDLSTRVLVNSDGIHDTTIAIGYFHLNYPQQITVQYTRSLYPATPPNEPYAHNFHRIVRIYIPGTDDDPPIPPAVVWQSPFVGPQDSFHTENVMLDTGRYVFVVSAELNVINSSATIFYKKLIPGTPTSTVPGPGMRLREINSYDSVHFNTPAITKKYFYSAGVPLTLTAGNSATSTHHIKVFSDCTLEDMFVNQYTSNYSSPLFTLAGNQFYYPSVVEINYDSIGSGKTVYEYSGDGISALGVNLVQQSEFAYDNSSSSYKLLHRKRNTYANRAGVNFYGFTYGLEHVLDGYSGPQGCYGAPELPHALLDFVPRDKIWKATPYALTSDCLLLTATDDTTYDQNGEHPMIVHTDNYYENDNHLLPTRVVVKNSKGEIITTQTKYPYDCGVNPLINTTCDFPYVRDNWFNIKKQEISGVYQSCVEERYFAAHQYWSPNIQNSQNTAMINAWNSYNCENNYVSALATALGNTSSMQCGSQSGYTDAGVAGMQVYHIVNVPVEQEVSINRNNVEYMFGATRTEFTTNGGYTVSPKTLYQAKLSSTSILKSAYDANPESYLDAKVNFKSDANDNIIEQSKTNDVKMSYIWDYRNSHAIAQCVNSDKDNIAYTSFEADGKGRFNFSGQIITDATAPTGRNVYQLASNNAITITTDASKIYTVSLWANSASVTVNGNGPSLSGKQIGSWRYYEFNIVNPSTITVSGSARIDELRMYLSGGMMTTYTYDPVIGLTSQCNPNNHITYYEYDALGRLLLIRDEDRNILKQYAYNTDLPNTNTDPYWIATGNTRCKPCPQNNNYNTNILQREERDDNPSSATYNQVRWTDLGPSQNCDANADWQNIGQEQCELDGQGHQTGQVVVQQQDMNPCSPTGGQTRWYVVLFSRLVCEPYNAGCTDCTGESKKCINGNCEEGRKIYTSSVYDRETGMWTCTYHYVWSDSSVSQEYTETSTEECTNGAFDPCEGCAIGPNG